VSIAEARAQWLKRRRHGLRVALCICRRRPNNTKGTTMSQAKIESISRPAAPRLTGVDVTSRHCLNHAAVPRLRGAANGDCIFRVHILRFAIG
jgi:hypothetical protein